MKVTKKENYISETSISQTEIYPFVDELVETLCTDKTKNFIRKNIENENDKHTFLMFIFLYFSIELKILNAPTIDITIEKHKEGIKYIMSDIIKNPEKRKMCIEMFNSKFKNLYIKNETE